MHKIWTDTEVMRLHLLRLNERFKVSRNEELQIDVVIDIPLFVQQRWFEKLRMPKYM